MDEFHLREDPGFARGRVRERDHGVCAVCGTDTVAAAKWIDEMREIYRTAGALDVWLELHRNVLGAGPGNRRSERDYWDADHVIEAAKGGGACGLDNLQTLCIPCHKRKTAGLVRELAKSKRKQ